MKTITPTFQRLFLVLVGAAAFLALPLGYAVRSANLTSASLTLESPRLSFFGRLNAGNISGSSIVVLSQHPATSADAASTGAANLFEGDRVLITAAVGSSAHEQYEVADPSSTGSAVFTIDAISGSSATTLNANNSVQGADVIASRSGSITVVATTVTTIPDSKFRVLLPSGSSSGTGSDSVPDRDGWDITAAASTNLEYTCTVSGAPGYSSSSAAIGSVTIDSIAYHSFVCDFAAGTDLPAGAIITMTIDETTAGGNAFYQGPITPAAKTSHTVGYADTYNILAQQLDSSNSIIDQTSIGTAVIESVLVTASVPPQITFRILGIDSGTANRCGYTTSVTTTPTLVPFGDLNIDSFKNAAQEIIVSTNADNGYVLTAVAGDQLHRTDVTCTGAETTTSGCIPDATGNGGTMLPTTNALWTSTSAKGFAYTLDANNGSPTMTFEHDSASGGDCNGTSGGCFRQFADTQGSESPVTLFSSAGPSDSHSAFVCYKAIVSSIQEAGNDYSTDITYRATATF